MSSSDDPCKAQAWAAPLRRLWTVIGPGSECPAMLKASLRVAMKAEAVSGHPSDIMKANQSMGGHVVDMYSIQAATGQYGDKCIAGSMMCSGSEDFGAVFEDRTQTHRFPRTIARSWTCRVFQGRRHEASRISCFA